MPLDPRADFQDDGGTPMWRANHARVIDVGQPEHPAIAWFRRKSLPDLLLRAFLLAFALPWAVLILGLALAFLLGVRD
jgi:hypothetical protein